MAEKTRKAKARKSATQRSAVANGSRLFIDQIDGRTAAARRFRDLLAEIEDDLGGAASLSQTKRQLVRRFASVSVEAELQEMAIATGKRLDVPSYTALIAAQARLAGLLGLERVSKTIDLNSYLKEKGQDSEA